MTPTDRPDAAPVADLDIDLDPRRHNARTHGLTASIAADEAERVALEQAAARFAREMGPDFCIEDALVRRAAVADVRLQRCERAQELALASNSRAAVRRCQDPAIDILGLGQAALAVLLRGQRQLGADVRNGPVRRRRGQRPRFAHRHVLSATHREAARGLTAPGGAAIRRRPGIG